jgi:hypothetical protein
MGQPLCMQKAMRRVLRSAGKTGQGAIHQLILAAVTTTKAASVAQDHIARPQSILHKT